MAILPIRHFPDPLLKQPAEPVTTHTLEIKKLIDDMLETMYFHPRCVGLAASQVGRPVRLMVVDASRLDKPGTRHGRLVLVNPKISTRSGERLVREGCLSLPDYTGAVRRSTQVFVQGWDAKGDPLEIQAEGFEAVVFQHELDHLEGLLFLDRVGSLSSDVFRRRRYA